jgi:hypothetical protein
VQAFSLLEHAVAVMQLTGERDPAESLGRLPEKGLEELLAAACQRAASVATTTCTETDRLNRSDALSLAELETIDDILARTDSLHSVLDLAAQLADRLDESDVHAEVGKQLFGLDALIDLLYTRPDVISVRWRVLQRPDGTIPGWLTRARELDKLGPAARAAPEEGVSAPPTPAPAADEGPEFRVPKLFAPEKSVIRFRGEVAIVTGAPGRRLSGPHSSPDGRLGIEVLTGPDAESLTVEFASRESNLANTLVGYVLAPGVGGESVVGFAVLALTGESDWAVGEAHVPAGAVSRLGGTAHGVTAGPVRLESLSEEDYRPILDAARSGPAPAWMAWAAELLRNPGRVPAGVRPGIVRLAAGNG